MALFPFVFHTPRVVIPDDPVSQFGGGYSFGSRAPAPKQREFVLSFDTMISYINTDGTRITSGTLTSTYDPRLNIYLLIDWYADYGTWKSFTYTYPPEGVLSVKFKGAFEQPKVMPGGYGVSEGFELRLIEQH